MFLELSFASPAGDKETSSSKASRSWRYDQEEKDEMSLDELISDFHQSATSRQSKLNQSKPRSNTSSLRIASPPKHSKARANDNAGRPRSITPQSVPRQPAKSTINKKQYDDSSDDEVAVSPTPRIEHVLRNRPSLVSKRCSACSPLSIKPKPKPTTTTQHRKPQVKSPVLSSPSIGPPTLSPVTSSLSEDIYTPITPDEDSIDALIGKEIRDLNELISTGRRVKANNSARSSTTDEVSNVIRQSTRFGKAEPRDFRSSLRLPVPKSKSRRPTPESPPPPPPPENSEDDDEDSFAEELRKIRESRRQSSKPTTTPAKVFETESQKVDEKTECSEVCAVAAVTVRNASNAISEMLLEAMKPFEGREKEDEKAEALEEQKAEGDAVSRNAANAELQSATQTIVSQLDLTFANMTERRKADLKAEEDAAAAMKEAEKKEKEVAGEKKRAEEKDAKERELEILRLIPMQGKLLTCPTDIENVLQQLEDADISVQIESTVDTEIKALRSLTERKIQEIEAKMSAKKEHGDSNVAISWRNVDWVQDNLKIGLIPSERQDNGQSPEEPEEAFVDLESAESEVSFEEVVQRRVVEKLDLTILKLRHVLAIDTKEAVEVKATQQREQEEQKRRQVQQLKEDEQKQRELEDAETARRRVMGLTSIDEVEGWVEEGRRLQNRLWHNQSLNRLMEPMEKRMKVENSANSFFNSVPQNPNDDQFDHLPSAMKTQEPHIAFGEGGALKRSYRDQDIDYEKKPERRTTGVQELIKRRWIEVASCSSDSDVEADSRSGQSESDEQNSNSGNRRRNFSLSSPPGRYRGLLLISHKKQGGTFPVQDNKYTRDERVSSKTKHSRRKGGARSSQHEVARTIQALQAERRQKATWIRSRLCSPSRPVI